MNKKILSIIKRCFFWGSFLIALVISACFISWILLAQFNFGYQVFYEFIEIDRVAKIVGPRHRYKPFFEDTSKAERVRIFAEIVTAIHNDAEGLDTIVYHRPDGEVIDTLLRKPEILHLQDVARLVSLWYWVGWSSIVLFFGLLTIAAWKKIPFVRLIPTLLGSAIMIGAVLGLIFWIGPRKVFYLMHVLAFPPDRPWSFRYDESLMTLMMRAPDLFGWIGGALAVLAFIIFLFLIFLSRYCCHKQWHDS